MKAENLKILRENGMNVPQFTVVAGCEEIDLSFSHATLFAVRSSFAGEDSEEWSFAGQFESLLNVKRDEVKGAVEKVLESARTAQMEVYGKGSGVQRHACREENVTEKSKAKELQGRELRVVIQEMVQAERSGVMFSANPIGILNETVVVVGEGLGCNVVEDRADTTAYYYNRDDGIYYFERTGASPLLREGLLQELLEQCDRIVKLFGREMDIEFAIRDDEIYILQARPITTLQTRHPIILDNSNIVESYPGVSAPMTQGFIKDIYYGVFRTVIGRITKDAALVEEMDETLRNMTEIANGRAYYRINNWYEVLRLLPFDHKLIPMWQEMLGVRNRTVPDSGRRVRLRTKLTLMGVLCKYLLRTPVEMERLNTFFSVYSKEVEEHLEDLAVLTAHDKILQLLQLYHEVFDTLVSKWDITLINDMYAFIYTALSGKKNRAYIADIRNLESMQPVLEMARLTEIAEKYGMDSREYQEAKAGYIERYGDRCLNELKLETKTYRTNPERLDAYIAGRQGKTKNMTEVSMPVTEHHNLFVKRAKLGIRNREVSRMNRTRIFGIARRIFLSIGEELVKQGKLSEREDIFYLTVEELDRNAGQESFDDFRHTVLMRKQECAIWEEVPAYSRLIFSEKIINKRIHGAGTDILHKSNELVGIASSVGNVTGEVLVIESPEMCMDTRGKIIVTKMTDPGWVFLIEPALGIIAEKGSILSHTAIITRELHIPSIVNVKDATKLLKTGDKVEMDAVNGVIRIVERVE